MKKRTTFIVLFVLILCKGLFAQSFVMQIDDPNSSQYIRVVISGIDENEKIYDITGTVSTADYEYFDGLTTQISDALMTNHCDDHGLSQGDVYIRNDYFDNTLWFNEATLDFNSTWADLNGANISDMELCIADEMYNLYGLSPAWIISINGSSSAPEMNLKQDTTPIANNGSHDFGSHATGTNTDVTFTIENTGNADLTLSGSPIITIGGVNSDQFSVQQQPTSPVSASGYTTFEIRFTPTSTGAKTATISIANNDGDENPYDLTINGTGTLPPPNGSGTSGDPYLIATLSDLQWLSENSDQWDKYFRQTANIDASATNGWDGGAGFTPIGNSTTQFSGSYDGGGYIISGLFINRTSTEYVGLFGRTYTATIFNLGVTNVNISGYKNVGGLVGSNWSNSTIRNCFSTGTVSSTNWYVGGLVGGNVSSNTSILNSYSTATVSGNGYTGGLIGSNAGPVTNCYSTGGVSASFYVGGLIGSNGSGTVLNSFWDTETSGTTTGIGYGTTTGATGKTTAEMKTLSTFTDAGWDFMDETANGSDDYWGINASENSGYPFLEWQGYSHVPPTAPEMDLKQGTTPIADGGSHDFGSHATGTNTDVIFTIENTGDADLTLSGTPIITIGGTNADQFSVQLQPTSPVAASNNTSFEIRFSPTSTGAKTATISIANNDGDENPYDLTINGTGTLPPPNGSGTEADPYQIATLENLQWLSQNSNQWGAYYIQTANIDASATNGWDGGAGFTPIGNSTTQFSGSYDGGGYIISGLFINRTSTEYVGLFGRTYTATIFNLGVTNVNISGYKNVGGLVGSNWSNSTIRNCFSTGTVSSTNWYVGGLVGGNVSSNTSILNSYSTATVSGNGYTGGLIGSNAGPVTNCYSTGGVSASFYVGGLIGSNGSGTVLNSFWDTETSGTTTGIGYGTTTGATGKTTAEMKTLSTFTDAGWDFMDETANGSDDYWGINASENSGYPFLEWQGYSHVPPTAPEMDLKQGTTPIADGGSHDFGSHATGTNTDVIFTIENTGDADLTLSGTPIITIGGTNADQFSVQLQPTSPVAASNNTSFEIRFSPTSTGAKTATISIVNNDANENPYDLTITGTGTIPEINLKQGATDIADGGSYNFGEQASGSDTDVTFTIENTGTADLTLSGTPIITIAGTNANQFSVQAQPTSPVTPSGNTTFEIRFSPTSSGAKTATIAIANNDADENPYNLTLNGTGKNTQPTATNTTQTKTYTEGAASVAIDDIVVTDPDAAEQITAALTLSNTATGGLTASSGKGETYTSGTGVWTITGSVVNVNSALAAVAFEPESNNDQDATVAVNIKDGLEDGSTAVTGTITLDVTGVNDPPTISEIADQTTDEDTPTGAIAFTVDDVETDPADLTMSGSSNNQTLVPNAKIVFGGSGENRTVTITPADNQSGQATITVTVSDGEKETDETFVLTVNAVNDAPWLDKLYFISTHEDIPRVFTVKVHDNDDPVSSLTLTANSSEKTIVPDAGITFSGNGTERTATINPAANQFGDLVITINVSDGKSQSSKSFDFKVRAVNDLPTISDIRDQITNEDTPTSAIPFTIDDVETVASGLNVYAYSNNQTLAPNGNIVLGGSGANRTITVTPGPDETGTVRITVRVKDSEDAKTYEHFNLTVNAVNDPPTISDIADTTINEDSSTGALPFTISDSETNPDDLSVSVSSDNQTLIPESSISLAGSGAERTVTVTPIADLFGTAHIVIEVSDGENAVSDTFTVTVNPVNDPPIISDIADQITNEDTPTEPIEFIIGDVETDPDELTLSTSSDNQALITDENIVFGGSGTDRTVTITPLLDQHGTATITVTVSDGEDAVSDTFTVTVNDVNDPPIVAGIPDIFFDEDDSTFLDLDGYVTDADNDTSELAWTVEILNDSGSLAVRPQNNNSDNSDALLLANNNKGKKPLKVKNSKNKTGSQIIVSASNSDEENLIITIDSETHVATFKAKKDFSGADISVVFFATDPDNQTGNDTTLVTVNPVNDPPRFIAPMPKIELVQGVHYSVPRSLPDMLVYDPDNPDSTLTWSIEDHPYLAPSFTEDSLTFTPSFDWYGTDTLIVTVSDGELSDQALFVVDVHVPLDETPPAAPVNFVAACNHVCIDLCWDANSEDDVFAYNIYRTTDSTDVVMEDRVATILHPLTAFSDSTVELETEYYYWLTAVDTAANESDFSKMCCAKLVSDVNETFSIIPDKFELSQNYPNPFNPSTTIKFSLPKKEHVKIVVYNLMGQQVTMLMDKEIEPGYHSIRWDAKDAKSGIYIYRIQAGEFMNVKKCLMIK